MSVPEIFQDLSYKQCSFLCAVQKFEIGVTFVTLTCATLKMLLQYLHGLYFFYSFKLTVDLYSGA